MSQFTPEDYVNAIVLYAAKYLLGISPEKVKSLIAMDDLEYALEWRYEDQLFPLDKGKVKTPEDEKLHCSMAKHWRKMDANAQQNWYKEMCKILEIEYEPDSDDE